MSKKSIVLTISIILLGSITFVFNSQMSSTAQTSMQANQSEMPDYVVYRHLFRHVAAFKDKADEIERQGKNAEHLRGFFKHKAELNDYQAQMLDQIAVQCALEIKLIDERAKLIIEAYKAQYPNGQVPHGQLPLPPPAELGQLTKERNDLVLRKRDELRAAFGDEEFGRFQDFVKNKIAPNVTPVTVGQ